VKISELKKVILLGNGVLIAYGLGTSFQKGAAPTLAAELSRRRFWACFLIMSFGSKVDFVAKDFSNVFEKVPLPCTERQFETGFASSGNQVETGEEEGSIYAELIRALSLW